MNRRTSRLLKDAFFCGTLRIEELLMGIMITTRKKGRKKQASFKLESGQQGTASEHFLV